MKYLIFCLFISLPAIAQLPRSVQSFAKQAVEACKDDKSKITGCESYTEIKTLKVCLMKNSEKLSTKCKTALKLIK